MTNGTKQNTTQTDCETPVIRKQIGKTTYVVKIHFNEASKETIKDKIIRLLRSEVMNM